MAVLPKKIEIRTRWTLDQALSVRSAIEYTLDNVNGLDPVILEAYNSLCKLISNAQVREAVRERMLNYEYQRQEEIRNIRPPEFDQDT